MTRTDKTHYTVPDLVAYDIATTPPPPGMVVNCISCWGVSRQGIPDGHTVAWYPLAKMPAGARARAATMFRLAEPEALPDPKGCNCGAEDKAFGPWHSEKCPEYFPF